MSEYDIDEILKKNSQFIARRKELNKEKSKKKSVELLLPYSKLANEAEDNYKAYTQSENKDSSKENKLTTELKLLLADFADVLYDSGKYEECILIDKRILKLDQEYHKSYARLFESYCKINQNDNAVIFGHMLKIKFRNTKILEKYYSDLIPRIDEEIKTVAANFKNQSMFKNVKFTTTSYIKFILFIFSIIFLLHGYFTKK